MTLKGCSSKCHKNVSLVTWVDWLILTRCSQDDPDWSLNPFRAEFPFGSLHIWKSFLSQFSKLEDLSWSRFWIQEIIFKLISPHHHEIVLNRMFVDNKYCDNLRKIFIGFIRFLFSNKSLVHFVNKIFFKLLYKTNYLMILRAFKKIPNISTGWAVIILRNVINWKNWNLHFKHKTSKKGQIYF